MVRKSRLITELSKEEIIEICVKCFDYKPEHIVSLRRDNATRCIKFINKLQVVFKNLDYINDMLETIKANTFEIEHTFDYYLEKRKEIINND